LILVFMKTKYFFNWWIQKLNFAVLTKSMILLTL
jgi:hypothetical protein